MILYTLKSELYIITMASKNMFELYEKNRLGFGRIPILEYS